MKRKMVCIITLIAGVVLLVHPGSGVYAQGLSFPAEINKSFTPISIASGGISRLNVTIYNPNTFSLSNAAWTDNLVGVQPGLSIANPANISNTCGGTVTAVSGTTTLSLSRGTVPAQVGATPGECTVGINVTSTTIGNLINTIPANALSSTGGGFSITNTTPASATVTVVGVAAPTVTKAFAPNTVWVGDTSVLAITINNRSAVIPLTQVSITDTLPTNVAVASPALPANALQNCGGSAVVTATPGGRSVTLTGGTIPPGSSCVVRVNVTSSTPGVYTNTIPANAVTTQEGVTNGSPASAPLNVQPVGISKGFSPSSFQAGDTTTLTITLRNPTASAYTGASISDTLPGTVLTVVAGSATTTCGGVVSITLPRTVTLTGGTIPGGSSTTPGICTISVRVTAPPGASAASYTNTIPAGSLVTNQGVTNILPATAPVSIYAVGSGITADKSFSPSTIDVGGNSRLRINMRAPADTALTNFSLTDNLPAGVVISNSQGPNVTNCGTGATLTAVTGTGVITLTNGTIAAGAQCRIDVWVTSDTAGRYPNIIPPANISNNQNRRPPGNLTATLNVLPLSDLSASKTFAPGAVAPLGLSTLTITLQNTNTSRLVNVSVLDNLPADLTVADPPNASTTCAGGTVTAVAGMQTIQLTGGSIPAQAGAVPGLCTITVNILGSGTTGSYTNTIQATDVSGTIQGTGTTINPTRNANAPLVVTDLTIGMVKGFEPLTVFGGSASTMSIDLINPNDAGLSNISFTDDMPSGMFLANPPSFSVGTCEGTLTGTPGQATFTFTGGSLPAKSLCTLNVNVTMNVNGNLTNTIPAGAVTTQEGASNLEPAEATLTNLAGASVGKFFAPNPVAAGKHSLLTITIRNTGTLQLTGMGLIDNLPAGLAVASPPAPAPVNNCGGTLTAARGSKVIQLTGGVLAPASDCTMVVAVVGASPGEYENIIPTGSLKTDPGITNTTPAIDTLVVIKSPNQGGGGPGNPDDGGLAGPLIPVTGFAPGRVTDLSGLPATRYSALNDVTLEIPILKLRLPVVGVPMKNKAWDVNWLLNQAGWLEGSAFPGFSGNSVLTSHVTLQYGQAGPFADLHKLKNGDMIFVHSFGDLYIYEVKTVDQRSATDPAILQHEEKPWLTLVTCVDYSEEAGTYLKRLVVKAELVQVRPDRWWSGGQ